MRSYMCIKHGLVCVVFLYVIRVGILIRWEDSLFVRQYLESNRLMNLLQQDHSLRDQLPQNSFVSEQQMEPVVSGELCCHL